MKVLEILKVKGNILYTVTPETPLTEAINTLDEHDIGSLVVMNEGQLVGMLTFREVVRVLAASQRAGVSDTPLAGRLVGEVMNCTPTRAHPEMSVDELRRLMSDCGERYLPVMDGTTLLGVLSFHDVARAVLEAQTFENRMLKAYIRDWPAEEGTETQ